MIGGLAVNHWAAEPMATADVVVVVALEQVDEAVKALTEAGFTAKQFEWSVNLKGHSKVSVQISTEEFYRGFPSRAVSADVHGIPMRIASVEDTLRESWKLTLICNAAPPNVRKTCSTSRV